MSDRLFIDFGWSLLPRPVKIGVGLYYTLNNIEKLEKIYHTFCFITNKAKEISVRRRDDTTKEQLSEWVWVSPFNSE